MSIINFIGDIVYNQRYLKYDLSIYISVFLCFVQIQSIYLFREQKKYKYKWLMINKITQV